MDKARLNCQRQRDPAWAQTRVDCRSGSRRGELGYVSTWKQVLLTRNGGQGRDRVGRWVVLFEGRPREARQFRFGRDTDTGAADKGM